jgi:hypothetical protein
MRKNEIQDVVEYKPVEQHHQNNDGDGYQRFHDDGIQEIKSSKFRTIAAWN